MDWKFAPDVKTRLNRILASPAFGHINRAGVTTIRGRGSVSRAVARIWSLPRPWQMVLKTAPRYIIEVISERFDQMPDDEKDKTLIHELAHIPKTFSGALTPHREDFNKRVNDYYTAWRKSGC